LDEPSSPSISQSLCCGNRRQQLFSSFGFEEEEFSPESFPTAAWKPQSTFKMRRRVKFQGVLADEGEENSSVGLNSLFDRSQNSKAVEQDASIFSTSNNGEEEEESTTAWTLSSIGHGRRLYGRSKERNTLRQAYRSIWESAHGSKPTVQLALISGAAGVGKTALALSIRQQVLDDGGFFVTGKFDQLQSSELYSAIVSAFTELVQNVVSRGPEAVKSMRRAIQSAVHTEQRILTDMIPALEQILGPQKKNIAKEFRQSSDEVSCFKFVFRMFVRAISSPEFPIVFLLDDLHFADESSLDLLQSLVTDDANDGILFIGTYRIDKPSDGNIREFLKNKTSLRITDIPLDNLQSRSVDEMVAEIFSVVHASQIKPLTDIIFRQSSGNVFYIREFLRYLQEEGLLTFDEMAMEWVWDERKIQMKIDFRRAVELMTVRISKLPKATREVLEVAACLGSKLDEKLLNRISPRPVFAQLQKAASRGFLHYDEVKDTYKFAHDVIQEAAYKLIASQEREAFHLTIGRELWKSFDDIEDLENHIFVILGQIRGGADLISYQEERNDVAALCLRAGELAICSSSFQTASEYLLLGVSMLGDSSWEDEYELSLELYNAAAEVEYSIANFDNVEKLASKIFENTRWFPDTLRAHSIHVYSLGSRGHMLKAIERGLDVLESLGEQFPVKKSANSIAVAVKRIKGMLRGKSNDVLLRMPLMDNPEKIAAMQMMNIMFLYAYIAVPTLAPLIAVRMVKLTLEYGLCDVSSVGFVTFAMLLSG
jgi:histidine kinase